MYNFQNFLPHRFYVKSISANFKGPETVLLAVLVALKLSEFNENEYLFKTDSFHVKSNC